MDDKRIEEKLQESWKPQPPDGMRDRVLRSARQELLRQRSRGPMAWIMGWKPALAAAAVVILLLGGVSEHARGRRIAALTDGVSHGISAPFFARGSLERRRDEIESLLAQAPSDQIPSNGSEGDASL